MKTSLIASTVSTQENENFEVELEEFEGAVHIPMNEVETRLAEINQQDESLLNCVTQI